MAPQQDIDVNHTSPATDGAEALDALLNEPLPAARVDMLDLDINRFTDDVARRIHSGADIARRYGIDEAGLLQVCRQPEITKLIRRKRAEYMSEANVVDRYRSLVAVGLIEAAPDNLAMLSDPLVPPAVRADLVKTFSRVIGADAPEKGANGSGGAGGFAVNIVFSSGAKETISSAAVQVIQADPAGVE